MRLVTAGLFLLTAAFAQPPQNPYQGFTCTANAGTPVIVRVEGITEQVGDLLLQCTGGAPTPPGAAVPTANLRLTLNTNITSRLLTDPSGRTLSDALLLIDEPYPANATKPAGNANQAYCNYLQGTTVPPCNIVGTGGGVGAAGPYAHANLFPATPATGPSTVPNSVGTNAVEWDGVPIDPPGTTGTRIIRLTNVRANATQLGLSSTLIPAQIIGAVSLTGSNTFPIQNPQQPLANAQSSVSLSVKGGTGQDCPGSSAIGSFLVSIKEAFANALKPPGAAPQNVPGFAYNSESGFVPDSAAGAPAQIGAANFGTRLLLRFNNVAGGTSLVLPGTIPLVDSNGNRGGTLNPTGGTPSGSNAIYSPDASGNVSVILTVGDRSSHASPLSANITVVPSGILQSSPVNLKASLGFVGTMVESNSLFIPGSSNNPPIPNFGDPHNTGITDPQGNASITAATLTECTPQNQSLGGTGDPPPFFQSFSGPLVPASTNFGVGSPGLPVNNVSVAKDPSATWLNVTLNQTTTPVTATLTVNPASTTQSLSTNLTFSSRDLPGGGNFVVPVSYKVTPGPWFTRYGVANAASFLNNVIAPGEVFLLAGAEFAPAALDGPHLDSNGNFSTTAGNTQVLFDNKPAALYYAVNINGVGYVAGFAPFALDGKTQTKVQVSYNGLTSPPVAINVVDAVPALFTATANGGGQGAILNNDLSYNSSSHPESVGNQVVLFGTGAGQTTVGGRDGAIAGVGGPLGSFKLPFKIFIDGIEATDIAYLGPAPGEVEGLFQINVRIPKGVRSGDVPVVVQVGDKTTQPGVRVAIR